MTRSPSWIGPESRNRSGVDEPYQGGLQRKWWAISTIVSLATLLFGIDSAFAQQRDPAGADVLFKQGREAMKAGDYATACSKFAESERLDPAPGTVLNLAQCEERQGKLAAAMSHYRAAAEALAGDDPRRRIARDGLALLERKTPKLTIRLDPKAPAGTSVLRDGIELGQASLGVALPVDPGDHEVITRAPGRKEWHKTVTLEESGSLQLIAEVGPSSTQDSPAQTEPSSGGTQRTLGYVSGAIGVLGLGLGTYFTLSASSKNKDIEDRGCNDRRCLPGSFPDQAALDRATDEARSDSRKGAIALAAGSVFALGGLVLILTAPGSDSKTQVGVSVAPGSGLTCLRIGGVW